MRLSIIVAVGKNWQIGLNNRLLWHIPQDLKIFKELTTNHHIIMGRRTFESIGRPLSNRTSIVLSKNGFKHDGVLVYDSLEKSIDFCEKAGEDEAFVIGGGEVYSEALKFADRLYLTVVDFKDKGDTFFPAINFRQWQIIDEKRFDAIIDANGKHIPPWQHFVLQKLPK